jgi:hypothetical protein
MALPSSGNRTYLAGNRPVIAEVLIWEYRF